MRRGRPRKPEDYSGGASLALLHRARMISPNPMLGTPFGAMAFMREFTDYQVHAAERIVTIYQAFDGQLGKKRWPVSPSFEVGRGPSPVHEDESERERGEIAKRDYNRLRDTLSRFTVAAVDAMEELVVDKRMCPPGYLPQVKAILDACATAFGFKAGRRPVNGRR